MVMIWWHPCGKPVADWWQFRFLNWGKWRLHLVTLWCWQLEDVDDKIIRVTQLLLFNVKTGQQHLISNNRHQNRYNLRSLVEFLGYSGVCDNFWKTVAAVRYWLSTIQRSNNCLKNVSFRNQSFQLIFERNFMVL